MNELWKGGKSDPCACRYVDAVLPLGPYNWLESYCRLLQQDAASGMFAWDAFIGCAELAPGWFAIVTNRHLLCLASEYTSQTREADVSGQGSGDVQGKTGATWGKSR